MVTRLAWSPVKSPTCATSCRFHPKIRSWKGSTPSSRRNLITYEAPWASFSWTWSARRWRHLLSYLERCKHCQNLDKQKHSESATLYYIKIYSCSVWLCETLWCRCVVVARLIEKIKGLLSVFSRPFHIIYFLNFFRANFDLGTNDEGQGAILSQHVTQVPHGLVYCCEVYCLKFEDDTLKKKNVGNIKFFTDLCSELPWSLPRP